MASSRSRRTFTSPSMDASQRSFRDQPSFSLSPPVPPSFPLSFSVSLSVPLPLFLLSRRCTHVALRLADLSRLLLHTVISLKLGFKIHYSQVYTATRATDTRCASTGVRVFRAQGCCVRDFRGGTGGWRRRRAARRGKAEGRRTAVSFRLALAS